MLFISEILYTLIILLITDITDILTIPECIRNNLEITGAMQRWRVCCCRNKRNTTIIQQSDIQMTEPLTQMAEVVTQMTRQMTNDRTIDKSNDK